MLPTLASVGRSWRLISREPRAQITIQETAQELDVLAIEPSESGAGFGWHLRLHENPLLDAAHNGIEGRDHEGSQPCRDAIGSQKRIEHPPARRSGDVVL